METWNGREVKSIKVERWDCEKVERWKSRKVRSGDAVTDAAR